LTPANCWHSGDRVSLHMGSQKQSEKQKPCTKNTKEGTKSTKSTKVESVAASVNKPCPSILGSKQDFSSCSSCFLRDLRVPLFGVQHDSMRILLATGNRVGK